MNKYIDTIVHGDCLETVKNFPAKSINCVITSPPYWQLRDYGWTGQWGLEKTYQEYLEHLWSLMDEIKRVLRDDGTVWVNLGDTYGTKSGNMQQGNVVDNKIKYTGAIEEYSKPENLHKCLLLIPHRFAIGCIDRGWIVRNDIIWAKRNGMPESVTDRFSKKHEYFFFMVKSEKYYFNLDGIRRPLANSSTPILTKNIDMQIGSDRVPGKNNGKMKAVVKTKIPLDNSENYGSPRARNHRDGAVVSESHFMGANPGSVSDFWDIQTQPSSAKHYATFNTKLIDKPIIAGCPEGGIILDPFAGTATTLYRAKELKRNYIGIEGNREYIEIARARMKNLAMQPALI